jgi:integrase
MADRRRGRFEGSVYEREYRRQDGSIYRRWCACESVRLDNGRVVRVTASDPSKCAAIAKVQETKKAVRQRQERPDRTRTTLAAYLERWLKSYVENEVEETTFVSYRGIIRKHIVPYIGQVRLTDLRTLDVRAQVFAKQFERGCSPRIAQLSYRVLSMAFKHGVNLGELDCNPCGKIKSPRYVAKKIAPLTLDQCERLLNCAQKTRFYGLYVLAVTTGLRQGELFALQWSDLHGKTISVRRQVRNISNKHPEIVQHTKSRKDRNVYLSALALAALTEQRESLRAEGLGTGDNDLIFPDRDGNLLRRENFVRRQFVPMLKRAELPKIRFHDLRHTAATLLFQKDVHPKIVQEMLGHATVAFTLNVYSAWIPSMGDRAADAMDSLFA